MNSNDFQIVILKKGKELYRDMPWRSKPSPYFVLVSEIMLQQTQVGRVVPKFNAFIDRFPDISSLASASLADVVTMWSGLGYNRRAKYLHDAAKKITKDFGGDIPSTQEELMQLPGIGSNTAGAIVAYGFNRPAAFIETNIRAVYFHHFFTKDSIVPDKELLTIVRETLDVKHPRKWYWALMDYGTFLKSTGMGKVSQSAHYKKQSPLQGSVREVRGQIIRSLTVSDMGQDELKRSINGDGRFAGALEALIKEGLVSDLYGQLHLTK